MPKISVVLPVYNGEMYLKKSIDSILHQSFSDFELIIIDDCSTDGTSAIAQNYTVLDKRVFYYRNDVNLKLPESLNVGFRHAKARFWTWTSCDNIYLPTAFEEMVKTLESHPDVGLVYASMSIIDEVDSITGQIDAGPSGDLIFRNVIGACFLYRATIANKVGTYHKDKFLCEDYEFWIRIALVAKILPIQKVLYYYRRHSDSLSHQHEREIIAKGIKVQKDYYHAFVKTRKDAARFYAYLRARDIYNPLRQLYLLFVLFYSPKQFLIETCGLIKRHILCKTT